MLLASLLESALAMVMEDPSLMGGAVELGGILLRGGTGLEDGAG